ncbi:hypothetical protein V1292_004151 [Bradyrhizobium sp. AZCC 1719]
MLYAMLAYHVEAEVTSWTAEEDAALMSELLAVHERLNARKVLGPAARGWAARRKPAPCADRAREWSSTDPLPRPRSSCWVCTC